MKKDLILIPILVNIQDNKVHIRGDEICDWFLSEIVRAESIDEKLVTYEHEDFKKAVNEAAEYLEVIRTEEEEKLKRTNDTLVNNQIESVKQATTIKVNKTKETIRKLQEQGKTEEDPIVRLYRGRIRNFEISMEQKIGELQQKRDVSVGFNLVAGGAVKIDK